MTSSNKVIPEPDLRLSLRLRLRLSCYITHELEGITRASSNSDFGDTLREAGGRAERDGVHVCDQHDPYLEKV